MLPNTFTDAGTREFSRKRKTIFDQIYQDSELTSIEFKPRKQTVISLTPDIPLSDANDDAFFLHQP